MTSRLWITWEIQRRNRTASEVLGARLFEVDVGGGRASRYLRATVRTVLELFKELPSVVIAQNPSIVLAVLTVWYGKLAKKIVVIDAHNSAIERLAEPHMLGVISRWVLRNANLTVVSNEGLARKVENYGGRVAILPDPLPSFSQRERIPLKGSFNVMFICTWANDEPYEDVIRAGYRLPPDVHLYITGNSKGRAGVLVKGVPLNVTLTGFLPEKEFEELLHSVDVVMDLTSREDCLLCGAYEAVSAERPLILSDTLALREYFDAGALFTDNSDGDIASKILDAQERSTELTASIKDLKKTLPRRWDMYYRELEEHIRL